MVRWVVIVVLLQGGDPLTPEGQGNRWLPPVRLQREKGARPGYSTPTLPSPPILPLHLPYPTLPCHRGPQDPGRL